MGDGTNEREHKGISGIGLFVGGICNRDGLLSLLFNRLRQAGRMEKMKWLALLITIILFLLSHSSGEPSPQIRVVNKGTKSISEMKQKEIEEWREKYGVPISSEIER